MERSFYIQIFLMLAAIVILAIYGINSHINDVQPIIPTAVIATPAENINCVNGFAYVYVEYKHSAGYNRVRYDTVLLLDENTGKPLKCIDILTGSKTCVMSLEDYALSIDTLEHTKTEE